MDIITGRMLQQETLDKLVEELGRELTESELEVFWKATRIALVKGYNYRG